MTPAEYGRGFGPDIDPDALVIEPDAPEAGEQDIDDLIARSSIGAGLRDIAKRGIDAHLESLDDEMAPRKKRSKGTSPTARTLAECRRRGWVAQNVEQFVRFPPPGHRLDLFGVIDIIAIVPPMSSGGVDLPRTGYILGIQATASAAHHAHRRDKILAEPRAAAWVAAGGRLELWSWSKRGDRGKRKTWQLRVETYQEMLASRSDGA